MSYCPSGYLPHHAAAGGLPWYLELLYFWPGCSQSCSSRFLPHSQAAFALSPTHFHRGAIAFAGRLSCGLRYVALVESAGTIWKQPREAQGSPSLSSQASPPLPAPSLDTQRVIIKHFCFWEHHKSSSLIYFNVYTGIFKIG